MFAAIAEVPNASWCTPERATTDGLGRRVVEVAIR